jgi:hypothetical protein
MAAVIVLAASSYVWMSVRTEYRQDFADELETASRSERLERVRSLAGGLSNQEASDFETTSQQLIERIWAIYYPARAIARVPEIVPYTNGQIIGAALRHLVTPRILFPDKPNLPSDSEMVRKYSDIEVAGAEKNTSIAFGYAAESYIDFGVPLMFVPVFLYGFFVGMAYRVVLYDPASRSRHGVVTVIFGCRFFVRALVGQDAWPACFPAGLPRRRDMPPGSVLMGRREKMLADLESHPPPHPSH